MVCNSELKDISTLQWRHNERDGFLNHQRLDYMLNCWFRRRSKKTSKHRVTGLCEGNSPVTGEFPQQKASDAENVSMTSSWLECTHHLGLITCLGRNKHRMCTTLLHGIHAKRTEFLVFYPHCRYFVQNAPDETPKQQQELQKKVAPTRLRDEGTANKRTHSKDTC